MVQLYNSSFVKSPLLNISYVLGKTPYKQRIPMSLQDNSPFINGQHEVSNVSSSTGSLQSTSQFEFEDLPTWTLLPPGDGSTITSPAGDSAYEGDELQANKGPDIDEELCKRQKIQNGSTARNCPIEISNVLLKSPAERSTLVDGEPRKARLPSRQNSGTPAPVAPVGSSDARVDKTSLLAVENTKRVKFSSITSISSNLSLGPTTVIGSKLASRQSLSVTHESLTSHSRKRTYGLDGTLVPRPLAMSKSTSTSDFSNSEAFKDPEEPPRKTRGLALRPTNATSYGGKSKKSLGREADQSELELWTNADVARVRFMKPDELRLHEKGEEENVKRNVSCILASLMEMEEDVARDQRKISKGVQNQVAMPASSVYTRCDDLVEEIFGPDSGNRGMTLHKPRMNAPNSHRSSVDNDGDKEDEEMRYDTNSLQVPLAQLEDWSIALRSLIKGKKRFQDQVCWDLFPPLNFLIFACGSHQDLINLKNILQEIYNNRAKISATSSLAQVVYELSRLGAHDVPNGDELGLRALARQSMGMLEC